MSSRWTITDEFGNVRLEDTDLPGIFASMSITQEVEMETTKVKGRSGSAKQIVGYTDAKISLSMILHSDDTMTCYERLEILQSKFRSTDRAAIPQVMKIINVHTEARGIEKVIFRSLNTKDDVSSDTISASIEFEEYCPVVPVINESRAATPSEQKNAPSGGQGMSDSTTSVLVTGGVEDDATYKEETDRYTKNHNARIKSIESNDKMTAEQKSKAKSSADQAYDTAMKRSREDAMRRQSLAKSNAATPAKDTPPVTGNRGNSAGKF